MELIIHPHELTDRWIALAEELKLDRLSMHPKKAAGAMVMVLKLLMNFMTALKALPMLYLITTKCLLCVIHSLLTLNRSKTVFTPMTVRPNSTAKSYMML